MRSRRPLTVLALPLLCIGPLGGAGRAAADPLPASYSGSTHSDIVRAEASLLGGPTLATAEVGHTATDVDSDRTAEDSRATSANLAATVAGVAAPLTTLSVAAAPDTTRSSGLDALDVPGLLDTELLSGTATASYPGDSACPAVGTALGNSTTRLAAAAIGGAPAALPALQLAALGAVETTGRTALAAAGPNGGRDVVSVSSGSIADFALLGGRVTVDVEGEGVLTASSDGSDGSVQYTPPTVRVRVDDGPEAQLATGGTPLQRSVRLAGLGTADVTLRLGDLTDSSSGPTASGSVPAVLDVQVDVAALGTTVASTDLAIVPLDATATAPPGGVECEPADDTGQPVVPDPDGGGETSDEPPTGGTDTGQVPGPEPLDPVVGPQDEGRPLGRTPVTAVTPVRRTATETLPATGTGIGGGLLTTGLLLVGSGAVLIRSRRAGCR